MCFSRVPSEMAGWPAERDRSLYTSNQQLCPKISPVAENMACSCSGPGADVTCDQNEADPVLWNAQLRIPFTSGWSTMEGWCKNMCWCGVEWLAARYQGLDPQRQAAANPDDISSFTSTPSEEGGGALDTSSDSDSSDDVASTSSGSSSDDTHPPALNVTTLGASNPGNFGAFLEAQQAKCNYNCSVGAQCHGTDCNCHVVGAKYEPSVGQIEYFARCQYGQISGPLINRDLAAPCPCNTTYVSHQCCKKELDGLVWEAPELKLGELVKDDL